MTIFEAFLVSVLSDDCRTSYGEGLSLVWQKMDFVILKRIQSS